MAHYHNPHLKSRPYQSVEQPHNKRNIVDTKQFLKQDLFDQTKNRSLGQSISLANYDLVQEQGYEFTKEFQADVFGEQSGENETLDTLRKYFENLGPQRSLSSNIGILDRYLYFDSDAKDTDSEITEGLLRFSASDLNQNKPIDNIIEMGIQSLFVPDIATSITYQPVYFFYKHITILIEEMSAQSIFAQDSVRFHFEHDIQSAGISNLLTPIRDKFIFSKPFRDINKVSFRFRAPIKPVKFEQDIFDFTADPGTFPARIILEAPHGITVGDQVSIFLRNFASNVGNQDAFVNDQEGHLVEADTATSFIFNGAGTPVDFTGVATPVPGDLTVGFRRIAFTIRFRSITDNDTNQIVPT